MNNFRQVVASQGNVWDWVIALDWWVQPGNSFESFLSKYTVSLHKQSV